MNLKYFKSNKVNRACNTGAILYKAMLRTCCLLLFCDPYFQTFSWQILVSKFTKYTVNILKSKPKDSHKQLEWIYMRIKFFWSKTVHKVKTRVSIIYPGLATVVIESSVSLVITNFKKIITTLSKSTKSNKKLLFQ